MMEILIMEGRPVKQCFGARVAWHRLRRAVEWRLHPQRWAREFQDPARFAQELVFRRSPLQRAPDGAIATYTEEKIHNLRLACAKVDGLVIAPGEVFSFCRTVGRTTRRQGYRPALELHDGTLQPSVGGGLCQLSNLLFLLALEINAEIVERHRHSYDLFRDVARSVPFGCGATVFYNYIDFQFRNRLPFPVCLHVVVEPPYLCATVRADDPLPCFITIEESDHRFFRAGGTIYRTNCLWRRVIDLDGHQTQREFLFRNTCRVLYDAEDLLEDCHS